MDSARSLKNGGAYMDILMEIVAFPTIIFSVLVGVTLLYWGMVIVGAFDIDFLDFGGAADGADGALDGATEGAVEGAVEGATEGAAEGAAEAALDGALDAAADGVGEGLAEGVTEGAAEGVTEGAVEGAADSGAEAASHGGLAGLLLALRLRSAPVTVIVSLISVFGWVLSLILSHYAAPLMSGVIPGWLIGVVVFIAAFVVAVPLTSVASRPLGRFFVIHSAPRKTSLIGKVCLLTTGRVDASFGQAELDDGGAGLLVQVRCDMANGLKRGSQALIVAYDQEREAFLVEPYDDLLRAKKE